ncbi:acyltransferase [Microbacterium sp.]|uniref:acyltransferase family protein n=1 Tax=Microbacterium sp. TaxID=51671 RepID=UPI0025FB7DEE|nr:acyltransferase [Microbacterium sp.]
MTTSTEKTKTKARRLPGLDGLRGVMALCVIIVHVTAHWTPTILGITHVELLGQAIVIFFALSGFLIYTPFARAIVDGKRPLAGVGRYFRSRALRVFPAYLVIFMIVNALGAVYVENAMVVQLDGEGGGTGTITGFGELLLHLSLLQNYVPSQLQTGINSSWTLTAEIAFYALLPFVAAGVALLASRSGRLRPYVVALLPGILLIVVGFAGRVISAVWAGNSGLSYDMSEWGPYGVAVFSRSIVPWADNFGWGMVVAVVYLAFVRKVIGAAGTTRIRRGLWLVLAVGFGLTAAAYFAAPRFIGAAFALIAVAVILLLILPVGEDGRVWKLATWVDTPALYWIGTISLSVYLWHYPVIIMLDRLGFAPSDTWGGWALGLVVVTAVSVALGSASYLLIEKPAMQFKPRSQRAVSAP